MSDLKIKTTKVASWYDMPHEVREAFGQHYEIEGQSTYRYWPIGEYDDDDAAVIDNWLKGLGAEPFEDILILINW